MILLRMLRHYSPSAMPKHLKKISEEVIHENPWTVYKHDVYEKPDGEHGDYYYLETPGASFIVPILSDGKILLTLQHRYLAEKQSIEFPGGGIAKGSTPLDAAKIELREETGAEAEDWTKVGEFEPAIGFVKDTMHVFIAHVTSQGNPHPDDTEEIDILYRRPDEIEDMVRRGDIFDGPTLAIWAVVRHRFLDRQDNTV